MGVNHNEKATHLRQGEYAEDLALKFLRRQGLTTVCRNFRRKVGEIDLIMLDGNTLVMVEVRYRRSDSFGSALESVTLKKQARLIATAGLYLAESGQDRPVRFDVVAITRNQPPDWVKNAFQAT